MTTTAITTLDQLLAYAHVLEQEAVERYQELAEQMQVHHQPQLAELFQTMARVEGQHVDRVEALADGRTLPRLAPWDYRWADLESPERVPIGAEQYGMQPRQALELVLAGEERAQAFFAAVAASCPDPVARTLAAELAEEEQQHAALLHDWLRRYPCAAEDAPDLDEPLAQD